MSLEGIITSTGTDTGTMHIDIHDNSERKHDCTTDTLTVTYRPMLFHLNKLNVSKC